METEKTLCWVAMVIAGLITLIFALDFLLGFAGLGFFGKPPGGMVFDILILIAGGFILWQSIATYKEMA